MIYTAQTKKAMKISYKAHAGQTDKSGLPYVFHPFHLAEQMDDEDSTVVALLHDVAEDTEFSVDIMKKIGFNDTVIEALTCLTHDPDVPYMDYVRKIRDNPVATKVKLADLRHNMDLTRMDHEPEEKDLRRREKYLEAERILMESYGKGD